MVKLLGSVAAIVAAIFGIMAFFTMRVIEEGYVGVYRYNPFFIGKSYLDPNVVVGPNRAYMWPSTSMWQVKVAPTTFTAHAHDFMTQDRMPLDFDIAITFRLVDPPAAPQMLVAFGTYPEQVFKTLVLQSGDVGTQKNVSTGEFMSFLRDQVRRHHSNVFIAAQDENGVESNGAFEVERATIAHINKFLAERNAGVIKVENIALGRANPPAEVSKTIVETANQSQEIKTQAARLLAQVARKKSEEARAEADVIYNTRMNISSDQYVALQEIAMMRETCGVKGACTIIKGQAPVVIPVK